ncbi:MAG: c-type cytochrome biogenesis protein CcmI [Xanthobacteraceae bacterium]
MMLGVVLALMVAIAVFAVLWPLSSRGHDAAAASDVAVYRDQLAEIERDRAAGMIAPPEAEAARVEVSRRLLAAADAHENTAAIDSTGQTRRRRISAVAALVLMPIVAGVLYLHFGSPDLPGQPLASRLAEPQDRSIASLVARVEAHLAQNPDDGRGWEVIAPVYVRLNRIDDAIRAERNVLRILGPNPSRHADLAEALVLQANGVVTAEAKTEFEQAAQLDAADPRAQFYLGLAAEQDGRGGDAARIWRAMIERAPADAPWLDSVRDALARVDHTASPSAQGPSAEEIAAAGEIPPAERDKMVRSMVERLAARLSQDGSDVDGWLRLMRAYVVLGDRDKARNAAADARRALKDTPDMLRRIDEGAQAIGIDG